MNGFKPNAKMSSTCHYSHGGAVMKKAKGGVARGEGTDDEESGTLRMEKMPSGAQQYVRGSTRPEKFQTLSKLTGTQIDKMIAGSDDFPEQSKKAIKLLDAMTDNNDAYDKEVDDYIKKIKKAKGGAINAKRIANPNMPRPGMSDPRVPSPRPPMGGMMGNGPFGPRNPNGPRKPMGSPSPMSGGIMAGINSMVNTKAMPRKKGGMAKGKK